MTRSARTSTRTTAAAATLLAAGTVPLASQPAAALDPPVAFTSAPLATWQTNGPVFAVAQAGGLVFVGGRFSALRPPGAAPGSGEVRRRNLAVLDAATGAPRACAPAVTWTAAPSSAQVRALDVSPDGRTLYLGGSFSAVAGAARTHVAALDISRCSPVSGFRPQPNASVRVVEATGSRLFFGGPFTSVGGTARARAAAAGAVGTTAVGRLQPWAPRFDGEVRALALDPGRTRVVVGGAFGTVNGASSRALAVVSAGSGGTVKAFGGFVPAKSAVQDLAVDGRGFYTAHEGTGYRIFDGRIALDWSTLAQRWRDPCLGATQALTVYAGVLYSGSHGHDCSPTGGFPEGVRHHLLAQSVDRPTLLPWYPNTNGGTAEALGPRDTVVARTGSGDVLWVVGEFTQVEGVRQQGLTRFGRTRHTSAPSPPVAAAASRLPGVVRLTWRKSVDTDDGELTYRVYRDGGTTPVHTVTSSSRFWHRRQLAFVDRGLAPGSTHSYTVTASDDHTTTRGGARSVRVATAESAYARRVLADAPSSYWRYDETGGVFRSDAAKDQNGTLHGGATLGVSGVLRGESSKAITLPGRAGTIYGETRVTAPSRYSLETWFRTTTTRGGKIIGYGDTHTFLSRRSDRHVYMSDSGRLRFGVRVGADFVVLASTKAYNDGAWHHLVATQGSGGMALYVDGVRVARGPETRAASYAGYVRVGGDRLAGWPSRPTSDAFAGTLDETAVYPVALPASVVAAHHGAR